jgi:hypothetical protein
VLEAVTLVILIVVVGTLVIPLVAPPILVPATPTPQV